MGVTLRNTVSLFTGLLLIGLLFNPVKGIFDIPHQSCLFMCASLSLAIGVSAFLLPHRFMERLTVIDLIFILIAAVNLYFYPPTYNLFALGRFSLIIIYWSIRRTGGLNATVIYGANLYVV